MKLFERARSGGRFPGQGGVPADVLRRANLPRGEKVLAQAEARDGTWLLGTRGLLVVVPPSSAALPVGPLRVPWEWIEDAAWDQEASRLKVSEIGSYGEQRPVHVFDLEDPVLLLQLVRERVTASILLQRRVPVRGGLAVTVIGRRSPVGGPVTWMHAYDTGLDPADVVVAAAAEHALVAAKSEIGEVADDPI